MRPNVLLPGPLRRALSQGWSACGDALEELIFPWSCEVCGAEGDGWKGPLCPECRERLLTAAREARSCPRCALPVGPHADLRGGCSHCRRYPLPFHQAFCLGPYEGPIHDLCLRLKRERHAWLAPWLGSLLAEARRAELGELPRDAWVVPIPLHWRRRLRRGYNQAASLANGLAHRLDLQVHHPLRRIKATDHLAHHGAAERKEAMRGAFAARRDPALKGRTVLLVDDILTTGATSGAAARALKQAGARRIVLAVLARTL
ncbi:MAG: ComF family protein [Isosphaeraceae bacterium]